MAERRRRIAQEDRKRIVRAFEEPEQDYLVVADTLGVNRSTARGIVARFIRENRVDERPRGGRNNVKVNEEMRQCLEAILEENPMLTLEAINRKLREELPDRPHVHVRTVAKHLDGMLYTLKLAHRVPADRNRADVIQRRNEYAHWFLEEANLNHTVFIDECGFNIWTSRSQGRSRQGDRAYRQVCGQKGRNITICLAISPVFGLIYHKIQSGGMTGALFNELLENTNEHLDEHATHYLIFDGAPAHRRAAPPAENTHVKVLPPYTPFLNPVEQAISCLKAHIKADITRPLFQNQMNDRNAARNAQIPLGEYRKRVLVTAAERNLRSITVEKCAAWFRLMQSYMPRCLAREHIQG